VNLNAERGSAVKDFSWAAERGTQKGIEVSGRVGPFPVLYEKESPALHLVVICMDNWT